MSADPPEQKPAAGLSCAQVEQLVRDFLANREHVSERTRLRAHLAVCDTCRADYRDRVEQTAGLQRALRSRREERASGTRGTRRASSGALAHTAPGSGSTGSHAASAGLSAAVEPEPEPEPVVRRNLIAATSQRRLRVPKSVLLFSTAILLLALGGTKNAISTRVVALGGDVRALDRDMLAGEVVEDLRAGEALSTGTDGRARVTRGNSAIELAPRTALFFERSSDLVVRLLAGALCVVGRARIVTPLCVLDTEAGVAHVRLEGQTVTVTSESGSATITNHDGARVLSAGENASLTAP